MTNTMAHKPAPFGICVLVLFRILNIAYLFEAGCSDCFWAGSSTEHKAILAKAEAAMKLKCTYQRGDGIYRCNVHMLNSEHSDGIHDLFP